MSSTTLYGPIRAGRAFRESDSSNTVTAHPAPGDITITENDDGLIHFNWTNRQTRIAELDLIIFPSDAVFSVVTQSPGGRMHVLKFSSSDQRYFFWLQDNFPGAHASYAKNINGLLEDPEFTVDVDADAAGRGAPAQGQPASSSSSANLAASTASSSLPSASMSSPTGSTSASASMSGQPTPEQLAAFRRLVANIPGSSGASSSSSGMPDFVLSDILTPSSLAPLFNSASASTLRAIFPTLPTDMPIPPSPEALRQVVESSPFQSQVRALDRALQTGLLGSLVVGLGLPEEAGLGIRPFLDAVKAQAKATKDDSGAAGEVMDTD